MRVMVVVVVVMTMMMMMMMRQGRIRPKRKNCPLTCMYFSNFLVL